MGLAKPTLKPDLETLRAQIAALEKRPLLADGGAVLAERPGGGIAPADRLALLSPPAGLLHEVFADEQRLSGAALGFTLGLARGQLTRERQAILYLQLAGEAQELGLPYGLGLAAFGIAPEALVIGRIASLPELLWAMEEAIACRAVAAVIADLAGHPRALDFTASRRLSLRTAAAGASSFLIRYGRGREASAARLRWHVAPAPSSEQRFDPRAPGPPRYAIEMEKGRLGDSTSRAEGMRFLVDWTENGFVSVDPFKRGGTSPRRTATAPGAVPAALGDRLSQAG